MPGLVSVKTPPDAPPLRLVLPNDEQIDELRNPNSRSPVPRKTPSPSPSSSSRPKPSPKKKTPAATPQKLQFDDEAALDNPDLGPFLLKLARDTIANGDSAAKALEYSIRASKSFERCAPEGEPSLELAMSLHVVAAIYCSLGRYEEAVPVLERAIAVPYVERGADHALAAFSGYMQLGDTHSMLGQLDRAVASYQAGMRIQIAALGEKDPRVAETCR